MREFGRQVYLGRMVDGLTTGFDRLIINGFRGAVPAGFYNIAATMSQPLGMLSRATSASAYRSLASADRIPRKLLIANLLWCTAGAVALVTACEVLIPVFFTHAYNDALALLPVVAAGTALAGLNEPFHAFLSARRQGRALKVMSIATSLTTVTLNFVLIPVAGAMGAGIAMTASYALNIVLNLHYYRTFLHSTAAERAA
jgi:O-antigen/teichoic acid export membrane protein